MANESKWKQQQIDVQDLNAILEGVSRVGPPARNYSAFSGDRGFPSPDFMIIHDIFPSLRRRKRPLELHGFPPWQITLTEFQCVFFDFLLPGPHTTPYSDCSEYSAISLPWVGTSSRDPEPLSEVSFRRGLDEFAGAQMRFGK